VLDTETGESATLEIDARNLIWVAQLECSGAGSAGSGAGSGFWCLSTSDASGPVAVHVAPDGTASEPVPLEEADGELFIPGGDSDGPPAVAAVPGGVVANTVRDGTAFVVASRRPADGVPGAPHGQAGCDPGNVAAWADC